MLPPSSKRPICPRCERPQRTCICHWITPVACDIDILILQHPLEVHNAKGSARLLHLCLPKSRLFTGERISPLELSRLLYQPLDQGKAFPPPAIKRPVLLYPDTPGTSYAGSSPQIVDTTSVDWLTNLRLVIVDGTWRKSRKMLHLNPLLQELPRLALSDGEESIYKIRKAHAPDQLSTLEATCHALMRLENNGEKYRPVLSAFAGFVEQHLAYRDAAICDAV